ncbi:MAG: MTH1187 family thiamine-binding protein [Dehalococcoidia bacterium]
MIIEIQCLPSPPGTDENRYAHIEAAIAVIEGSGLKYEVGALGTTIEGEPDEVWGLARRAHEACLAAGAVGLVTVLKVEQATAEAPTIESLTAKFR